MIRRDVSALGDVLAEGTAIDRAVEAAYARTIQRHRQLNLPLAMWTGRTGRPSFGWYGLRRIAADMAETETTDDRVKDRLGGWQDSATRKHIYQDRETDRTERRSAFVRRPQACAGGCASGRTCRGPVRRRQRRRRPA